MIDLQLTCARALIAGSKFSDIERAAIRAALEMHGGSTSKAAKQLGISVRKIQYRIRRWKMEAEKKEMARFRQEELQRDEAWKAARKRLEEKLGYVHGVSKRSVPDYWVIDELHEEALEIHLTKEKK